jgi:hypothetical protein
VSGLEAMTRVCLTAATIRTGPLSDTERALIRAATDQAWTWALRDALRRAVEQRGLYTHRHDDCGMLADALAGCQS